jgi:hypothetical protein
MTRFSAVLAVLVVWAGSAWADITVRNAANTRVEVKIDSGTKTEVKSGDKAVFNSNKSESTVTVYSAGKEVASSKVKNNKQLKVTNTNGIWTIAED